MKTIEQLEEYYCIAANALNDFRRQAGFEPGAKVVAKYRDESERKGVIPPYGSAWARSGLEIPVQFENGLVQPWAVSNLRIDTLPPSP